MGLKIITHTARLFISTEMERLTDLILISTSKISIDELKAMSKTSTIETFSCKPEINLK